MTVLRLKRFVAAELVLDPAAVAATIPLDVEIFRFVMNFVGLPMFPLVFLTVGGTARLVLVIVISSPIRVLGLLWGHDAQRRNMRV